jgi:hypothetical protein
LLCSAVQPLEATTAVDVGVGSLANSQIQQTLSSYQQNHHAASSLGTKSEKERESERGGEDHGARTRESPEQVGDWGEGLGQRGTQVERGGEGLWRLRPSMVAAMMADDGDLDLGRRSPPPLPPAAPLDAKAKARAGGFRVKESR